MHLLDAIILEAGLDICFSDNFQDQMKRELSYREEMVQQLHIVRGETHKAEETLDSDTNVFTKLKLCVRL